MAKKQRDTVDMLRGENELLRREVEALRRRDAVTWSEVLNRLEALERSVERLWEIERESD